MSETEETTEIHTKEEDVKEEAIDESLIEDVKEEGDLVAEDDASAKQHPMKLNDVSGEVMKTRRFGIYISFTHPETGKSQIGGLFPGRSYVNGANLLLDICKSDQELSMLLPKGTKVRIDAVSTPARLVPSESVGPQEISPQYKKCGWVISMLWLGDKPKTAAGLHACKKSFQKRLDLVESQCWKKDASSSTASPIDPATDTWFVKSILMPSVKACGFPHPDSASVKGAEASISEVFSPVGGVVEMSTGEKAFFHRSRVYLDGAHLSVTLDLSSFLKVGTKVKVDYTENQWGDESQVYFPERSEKFVALLVWNGPERPEIPPIIFENTLDTANREKYNVARIVSFDPPGPSGVESGVAEILQPSDQTTLAVVKNSFKKFINLTPGVKRVRFHRNNMFHLGTLLHKADLQYIFSSQSHGMGTFYCYFRPIEGVAATEEIKHEVSMGWKSSVSFSHATAQGGLTLTQNTPEDTLLFPKIYSFQSTKFLGKEGIDVETYENIIEGELPPRGEYFNGVEDARYTEGFHFARVSDLIPPSHGSKVVWSGVVTVETGELAGTQVHFDRNVCTAFGWRLANADFQNVLEQNEPVFVKFEPVENKAHRVKHKATELWFGWPPVADQTMESIPASDRYKLLLYLETKGMTPADFLKAIKGEVPCRQFIPYRRDENKGTIIQLDPFVGTPKKGKGKNNSGAVSGVIKVDRGPLAGKLVAFNRRNAWVLGYNLFKADLTHIFIEGQKVSLEALELPKEGSKKSLNGSLIEHRATIVWTSKFRPRNDFEKTVAESTHVNNWLKKRSLDWDKFQLLVKGTLPIVDPVLASRNKSNMLKGNEFKEISQKKEVKAEEPAAAAAAKKVDVSSYPVLRHGNEASRICDMALAVTGPSDNSIRSIIKTDSNAQMAFHIYKTLGMALDYYKTSRQSPWARDEEMNGAANSGGGVFLASANGMVNASGVGSVMMTNPMMVMGSNQANGLMSNPAWSNGAMQQQQQQQQQGVIMGGGGGDMWQPKPVSHQRQGNNSAHRGQRGQKRQTATKRPANFKQNGGGANKKKKRGKM